MATKVTFNPANREIQVVTAPSGTPPTIDLNVKVDLYSDAKEDWLTDPELQKMVFPIRPIGGDPVPIGFLGETYLLENGWHIHPFEGDHVFNIEGNIFPETGQELVADTQGEYRVQVNLIVSTLVEVRVVNQPDLEALRKAMLNGLITHPGIGVLVIFEDDGTTVAFKNDIYSDPERSAPYDGTAGIESRSHWYRPSPAERWMFVPVIVSTVAVYEPTLA
jgi:hypothetical protein